MRFLNIFLTIATASACLCSCVKEQLEVTYTKQESQISSYIESALNRNPGYSYTHLKGSNRLTTVQGEGEELNASGSITFYYAGYIFNGNASSSNMFITNRKASADDAKWDLTDYSFDPLTINLKDDELLVGLKNGLTGVKAGEECEILFSGKYGFGKRALGIIPANSALLYKIWVISISND